MHIAIAGNIGSGKTTLTGLLAKNLKWEAHYEDVDTNPYLHSFYEDAYIFAPNLHSMNLMSTRDFENYKSLFELISSLIKPPDLIIYLRASVPTLVSQIQKRGREYESAIRIDYLKNLNDVYEEWVENYKLGKILFIDVDNLKVNENTEHLGVVIDKVNAELHGLF